MGKRIDLGKRGVWVFPGGKSIHLGEPGIYITEGSALPDTIWVSSAGGDCWVSSTGGDYWVSTD